MCSGMDGEYPDRRGAASCFQAATPIHSLGVLAPPLPPGVVARPPPPPGNVGGVGAADGSGNQQAASPTRSLAHFHLPPPHFHPRPPRCLPPSAHPRLRPPPPRRRSPPTLTRARQSGGGGGGAAGPVIGVIVALAVVGGAVYWYTKVLYLPWLPLLCYPYYGSLSTGTPRCGPSREGRGWSPVHPGSKPHSPRL